MQKWLLKRKFCAESEKIIMGFNDCKYPNLELMEYQFMIALKDDSDYASIINKKKKTNKYIVHSFEAEVFPQVWGDTGTAFDIMPDGSPTISGSAMTSAYTVVMHELLTDFYMVFVNNRPCYMVKNANEKFYEDLKNRDMASLSKAKKIY